MNIGEILLGISLVVVAVSFASVLRNRILVCISFRNILRHKRQAILIVAGLTVGTAFVAAAQVSGDSAGHAIRLATFKTFGEIDETIYLDGYGFFSESFATALANDSILRTHTDGIGLNAVWDASVTNPRTLDYEPTVRLVGFDEKRDLAFGPFLFQGSALRTDDLGTDEVVMTVEAANALAAKVGDTLTLNYTVPVDPVIPRFFDFEGDLTASAAQPVPVLPSRFDVPAPWSLSFVVDRDAIQIGVLVMWPSESSAGARLAMEVESPTGHKYNRTSGAAPIPHGESETLFVNGSIAQPLPRGQWILRVQADRAVRLHFNGTIGTGYAVYDPKRFAEGLRQVEANSPLVAAALLQERNRHTATVRVAAVTDGGRGPNYQLPNPLTLFLRLDALQTLLNRADQINLIKISNPGGVEDGVLLTHAVYPVLSDRLNATKRAFPDDASVAFLRPNKDKEFWLAEADHAAQLLRFFLTFVSSFAIIAGLLLIINIFTMLAEERKVELGTARAIGLMRRHLVRLFTMEGAIYAIPAAAAGTFAGLALARILIWGFNRVRDRETVPAIPFRLEIGSLELALGAGVLLTVVTVHLGARRASRLNIVGAIRNLEESTGARKGLHLWLGATLGSAGAALAVYAWSSHSFAAQLVGPTLLAIGLALLLRPLFRREYVYPAVALGLFVYLTATLFTIENPETREAAVVGPIRAIVMTLSLVVALVYTNPVVAGLGRIASHIPILRPVALSAASYPLHRRFRTGMTLAMFSVTLVVVMLFSIFGALFVPNLQTESGGYHVEATSRLGFDTLEGAGSNPAVLSEVERYDILPFFVRFGADILDINGTTTGHAGLPANVIYGMDQEFARANEFRLARRLPSYATDREAYEAVANQEGLAIVSYAYSTDAEGRQSVHGPGDILGLQLLSARIEFTIVGVMEQLHLDGVFISKSTLAGIFPNTDTLVLFRLKAGTEDGAMAKRIEVNYHDLGLDAKSIRDVVREQGNMIRQTFALVRLFLGIGLVVGTLSLGIVTARNVDERRQEIGMLRAIGFLRRHIRRSFLLETLAIVSVGILIGILVAILISAAVWHSQLRGLGLPYVVPWKELLLIGLLAFVTTAMATLAPILRAARTSPAEALRYIE